MDERAVDRILRAVGRECYPPNLDRAALLRCLNLCAEWYREALRHSTAQAERDLAARTSTISKAAKKLQLLLAEDDLAKLYDWDSLLLRLAHRKLDIRQSLTVLIELTERDLAKEGNEHRRAYEQSFRQRSAFEWLVGYFLPLPYMALEFQYLENPKAVLSSDSPYIRFVQETLKELGVTIAGRPYSRGSIVKAVGHPFSGQPRRKNAGKGDGYSRWRAQLILQAIRPDANDGDDGKLIPDTAGEVLRLFDEQQSPSGKS